MSRGTQVVIVIGLLQLAAIAVIYTKVAALEQNPATLQVDQRPDTAPDETPRAMASVRMSDVDTSALEEQIRQVIREELGAYLLDAAVHNGEPVVAHTTADPGELQSRRDTVSHQIEYYSSVGQISDLEMQNLQTDIANLDAAGRRDMIRKLVQEMNSGRLQGRL